MQRTPFPTMLLRHIVGRGVIIVGYRPYAVLCEALVAVAPELAPVRRARSAVDYVRHWGSVMAREVAEALDVPDEVARQQLAAAVAQGTLTVTGPLLRAVSATPALHLP